jgi:predicted Zn-dependent protease
VGKARAAKLNDPPPFRAVADTRLSKRTSEKQAIQTLREQVRAGKSDAKVRAVLAQIKDKFGDAVFQKELRAYAVTKAGVKGAQDVKLPPGVAPNVGRNK